MNKTEKITVIEQALNKKVLSYMRGTTQYGLAVEIEEAVRGSYKEEEVEKYDKSKVKQDKL